jgi:hypothetical protein
MNKFGLLLLFLLIIIQVPSGIYAQENFFAYYTKIHNSDPWEEHSRTGEFADLVIQINKTQKVVFNRGSSYLPYLEQDSDKTYFDEIIERSGDGPEERPDKNNIYSFVRLIEGNDDSIVVHWRYFPDFKLGNHIKPIGGNVEFDGVVHEYFTFYPSGMIKRTIRVGTKKFDDWIDPLNRSVQTLRLNKEGIDVITFTDAKLSKRNIQPIEGASIRKFENIIPALVWHFDEATKSIPYRLKDITYESKTGTACDIKGTKTVRKKGISGTALGFDGYNTKVEYPEFKMPEYELGFSVEAWVAPGAYSISKWTAIAHQSEWEADVRDNIFQERNWGKMQLGENLTKGYFLGIDEFGKPVIIIAAGEEIVKVTATKTIPLNEWSHVAFTYVDEGMLYLYVNGQLTDFKNFSGHLIPADKNFIIGKNDESIGYVSQHVVRTYSTFPSPLGFDGLIDEVKIYPELMSHDDMNKLYHKSRHENRKADLQPRKLPGAVGPSESFGAEYTKLKYHDLWDNMWREPEHPDIVVKFDLMPTSVVFWRGNRSPGWVTETNKWISDQSAELTDWHWGNEREGAESCCEHMSDYQARHSHVRIIENTDARVVIHWRYASVDVLYKHPNTCKDEEGWGVWTDEYLTIYPDGVGVRTVDMHGSKDYYHQSEGGDIGFHDTQFLSEAGTRPEDNINPQSLTIVSHKDEVTELDWSEKHPSGNFDAQAIWINLKSDYKIFEVFPPGTKINVWAGEEKTSYSKYSAWNHYPVTQAPCDGRFCVAPDRLTHSALGAADNLTNTGNMLLYGFTNQRVQNLIPLARSWNSHPEIIKTSGCSSDGYEKSQRAYLINAKENQISFALDASEKSPVVNPCFIIKGWNKKAEVLIDDKPLPEGKNFRQGLVRDTDGKLQLVVWIQKDSTKKIKFMFKN